MDRMNSNVVVTPLANRGNSRYFDWISVTGDLIAVDDYFHVLLFLCSVQIRIAS